QINKNNWMIGGAASLRASNYDLGGGFSSKQTIVQLSGDVGYFIIDKLAIGLKPGYSRTETNNPHIIANAYEIGPFVRYYFLPKEKYVNIFSELSYQYGIMKTNQGVSQNSNNFSGLIGCAAFFNSSVALEFTLGYSSYLYNNNSGKVNSVIAGVGFHFHLEKEK
ncbi:MAG: outer membrane beta-barrel protein, partial [Sphingobacteriales bacterium]